MADLFFVNRTILFSQPLPKPSQVVQWVENQPGLFRVFSPSYGFPMPNTLQQANGVNPMHLNAYANFINQASNYSSGKYSTNLPDIYIDEKTPIEIIELAQYPNLEMLGQLNVKYIASSFALKSPGLSLEKIIDGQYLYRNTIL